MKIIPSQTSNANGDIAKIFYIPTARSWVLKYFNNTHKWEVHNETFHGVEITKVLGNKKSAIIWLNEFTNGKYSSSF